MCVENSAKSHKPVEINDLYALKIQGREGYHKPNPSRERERGPVQEGGGGCLEPRSLLLGDPGRVNRPLSGDRLSSAASGCSEYISGTLDWRCPPVRARRGRPHTARRIPPWEHPGLGPRCGFSALPWNSVVSPPTNRRRTWGFLRAIGPAVATRPPVESSASRDAGSRRPEPSSSSTPAKIA